MKKMLISLLLILNLCSSLHAEQTSTEFVERLYQNVLNRVSDEAGLNDWINRLNTESGAAVASGFLNSEELSNMNLNNAEYLNVLYSTLFDRTADQNGILYWLDRMNDGLSRERVQNGFYNSTEFSNLADSFGVTAIRDEDQLIGVDDFVTRFYELVLGRTPDTAGLTDWVNQLNSGTRSGTDIANGFFNSTEFANRNISDTDFLDILYSAFFNRIADQDGYNNWLAQLNNNATRQNVLDGFSNSQEFINLANEYGISASLESGNLLGSVLDYTNRSALPGITVTLYDATSALVNSTTTDTSGHYVFETLTEGNYSITFTNDSYLDASGNFEVLANTNNIFSQVLMPEISANDTQGRLSGYIKDAFSGSSLSDVTIQVYSGLNNTTGDIVASTTSSYNYSLDALDAGYYTIVLSKEGYITTSYPITIAGNNLTQTSDYTISPILADDEVRAVLTWGSSPSDLDSHMAYLENGIRLYHTYYSSRSNGSSSMKISLDTDDTSSYGPETVTVTGISLNGDYKYYVHNYSNKFTTSSSILPNSGASIKVYFANNVYAFNVPTYAGNTWKVFEINNGVLNPCTDNCVFDTSTYGSSTDFGARNLSRYSTITPDESSLFENLPPK
jgi:5-hydroxyisourate hydrolase-like protein (transthyretin family)